MKSGGGEGGVYSMVWYGMVWYGMVWYGMVWYGMVWYGMVWYGMVWGMVWYGIGWHDMVWLFFSNVLVHAMAASTIQKCFKSNVCTDSSSYHNCAWTIGKTTTIITLSKGVQPLHIITYVAKKTSEGNRLRSGVLVCLVKHKNYILLGTFFWSTGCGTQ